MFLAGASDLDFGVLRVVTADGVLGVVEDPA
jgi:hypothetical protein